MFEEKTIDLPTHCYLAVCQNLVPLVNIKIAGKWMFIPLKMVLIGIDPYPFVNYVWLNDVCWSSTQNFPLHPIATFSTNTSPSVSLGTHSVRASW